MAVAVMAAVMAVAGTEEVAMEEGAMAVVGKEEEGTVVAMEAEG